jgi:hypothetical protein
MFVVRAITIEAHRLCIFSVLVSFVVSRDLPIVGNRADA